MDAAVSLSVGAAKATREIFDSHPRILDRWRGVVVTVCE